MKSSASVASWKLSYSAFFCFLLTGVFRATAFFAGAFLAGAFWVVVVLVFWIYEKESAFFFKLVIFILLSALWLRLENPISVGPLSVQAFPLGLIVALLLVVKLEKYQFNRKIWYATLILMAILTSFTPVGIMV